MPAAAAVDVVTTATITALGRLRAALAALERNTLDATALRPLEAGRRHQTLARMLQRRGPLLCCVDRRRHCSLLGTGTKSPSGDSAAASPPADTILYYYRGLRSTDGGYAHWSTKTSV